MFSEGQTIVQRGLYRDGRISSVECARVLRDDPDGLVTWIGPRSSVVRRTTASGESVRYMRLPPGESGPGDPGPRPARAFQ
jgi:hypothetical protein